MKLLLAAALMLFRVAASTAAQSMAEVAGSIVDQTGAPLPGVRLTMRDVADRTATIRVFDIRNAAVATIRGIEVEGTSLIGRGIEAGGYVAWLDATYDQCVPFLATGWPAA